MDRELSPSIQTQRLTRRWFQWLSGIGLFLLAAFLLQVWLRPSVQRDQIRTSFVERGDVVASIAATGLVVPKNERVISTVFESEVIAVVATAGTAVGLGDLILKLDGRALELELAKLDEQLSLKKNLRQSQLLSLQESLDGYGSRLELLAIDLQSREAKQARFETLATEGVISKEQLYEANLDVTRTSVEIAQLEKAMEHAESNAATELERIELETSILRQQRADTERLLAECEVTSPRAGTVMWTVEEVGTRVGPGAPLARVADLSTFRIEAQVSDFYSSTLQAGLPAEVSAGEAKLAATVSSILPAVEGGQMTLQIDLDNPAHTGLRPRLRVDVEIITGQVSDTLRLKNGPAIGSNGQQVVYRIVDGIAERTQVHFGISNRHRVEALEGLEEGDEVIVSDTRNIAHLERFHVE